MANMTPKSVAPSPKKLAPGGGAGGRETKKLAPGGGVRGRGEGNGKGCGGKVTTGGGGGEDRGSGEGGDRKSGSGSGRRGRGRGDKAKSRSPMPPQRQRASNEGDNLGKSGVLGGNCTSGGNAAGRGGLFGGSGTNAGSTSDGGSGGGQLTPPPKSERQRKGKSKSRSPAPPSRRGGAGKSRSPVPQSSASRRKAKSKSPTPPSPANRRGGQGQGQHRHNRRHHHHHHRKTPADISVIANRVDVYDSPQAAAHAMTLQQAHGGHGPQQQELCASAAAGAVLPGTMAGDPAAWAAAAAAGGAQLPQGQQLMQPHLQVQQQQQQQHHNVPKLAVAPYRFRDMSVSSLDPSSDDGGLTSSSEHYYSCLSSEDERHGGTSAALGGVINAGSETDGSVASAPVASVSSPGGGAPLEATLSTRRGRKRDGGGAVAVVRAPHRPTVQLPYYGEVGPDGTVHYPPTVDNITPNPHDPNTVHDKYWAQRRRLFVRFDLGIQLDGEGWYSVTPERIADHVAMRLGEMAAGMAAERAARALIENPYAMTSHTPNGIVVLDAFCGCGGNTIAFGKLPPALVSCVVCVDLDRKKLRMAAHNASLYGIPTDRLIFVHANSLDVMERCYRDGKLVPQHLRGCSELPHELCGTSVEFHAGFPIGGVELLPAHIDAVFMDPPWGGIDYNLAGKNGYDLARHMKIRRSSVGAEFSQPSVALGAVPQPPSLPPQPSYGRSRAFSASTSSSVDDCSNGYEDTIENGRHVSADVNSPPAASDGGLGDDFFDAFGSSPSPKKKEFVPVIAPSSEAEVETCSGPDCVDGVDLLRMAAAATSTRIVMYDLPRNTNKTSLGRAALAAGYRGNIKLEEHYLNGRLKTVTAYLGSDYSGLLH